VCHTAIDVLTYFNYASYVYITTFIHAMKTLMLWIAVLLAALPASAVGPAAPQRADKITWYTLEQAQALAKKNPRKIFIDMYTNWCGWCKVMDRKTFSVPGIAKYVNENFYAVKLNAEQTQNIIFKGQVFSFNQNRGTHNIVFELVEGQFGYPTTIYLDEKLNVLQHISSYLEPAQLDPILHFYGENAYKKTEYEDFAKGYKSTL
jgi:thioredoxin-related protein